MGHGCKLSPGCINSEFEAFGSQGSLSFTASSAKKKEQYETTHFLKERVGKKGRKHHWL